MKSFIKNIVRSFGYDLFPYGTVARDARQMQRLLCFKDILDMVKGVEGDVVECGVGRGQAIVSLAFLIKNENNNRRLMGVDSFEGFPEPSKADASFRAPKKGEWAGTSVADVYRMIRVAGLGEMVDKERVVLRKGFFGSVIDAWPKEWSKIALLHIDGDLYESYVEALRLVENVSLGGVVLFDEYNESAWPGATKAVDEFLATHSYTLQKHPSGKYYFVKK